MISKKYRFCCLALIMVIISVSQSSYSQTSRDSLNQYVAALQKSPDDSALRAKIILLAQTIKPALVVSEDADRFMVRGKTAIELAKESKDYENAIAEFNKVTLAAPWLSAGYFNLALAQELSADYFSAIKNYKFYLLAEPDAADAKDVKTKTYELEYKNEQADKLEKQRQAVMQAQKAVQQAKETAKEQRRIWASNIVAYLKQKYGDRVKEAWHNGNQIANHEKKLSGNLLPDNRRFLFSITGTDNDQIQMTQTDRLGSILNFYGVPTGSGLTDIKWTLGYEIGAKDDPREASIKFGVASDNSLQPSVQICYWTSCTDYFLEVKK